MYLTSTVKLPATIIQGFKVDLWGLEPMIVPEGIAQEVSKSSFAPYIHIEKEPVIFKKRYYKGCLSEKKDAKLLVIRYGGIGDIQWTMPTLREIKKRFPDVKIRYSCFEKDREMLFNCPFIDEIVFTKLPTVEDVDWADFVLDFFDTVEGQGCDEAKVRNPIDINEDIIGYKIEDKSTWYLVEDFEIESAKNVIGYKDGKKYIGISLTSSNQNRTWRMQDELIKLLDSADATIVLFGENHNTQDILSKIKAFSGKNKIIDFVGKLTLRKFVAMASICNVNFCNDSGIVHILGGLGKKVLSVYTTVPKETRINHYPNVRGIQARVECSPCYKLGEPCEYNFRCVNSIEPIYIYKELMKLMEE